MKTKIEELLTTPRMYYSSLIPQNCIKGLYDLIKEHVNEETIMVEVGSFSGISSELFALHCKQINCVDRWESYNEINTNEIVEGEKRFDLLKEKYSNINKVKSSSEAAAKLFKDDSLDLVYIDAAHDYKNVKNDILYWLPKVKPGGIIAGHDIILGGVQQAVVEIFGNYKQYEDTSWLIIKNK